MSEHGADQQARQERVEEELEDECHLAWLRAYPLRRVANAWFTPRAIRDQRAAIEQTLRQVHWNRRKAAQILGVSYKTLLNKIKECGISRV